MARSVTNKNWYTIFRYDFVVGGQMSNLKSYLKNAFVTCDRIEKDGWDQQFVGDCQKSAKRFSRRLGVAKRWLDPG